MNLSPLRPPRKRAEVGKSLRPDEILAAAARAAAENFKAGFVICLRFITYKSRLPPPSNKRFVELFLCYNILLDCLNCCYKHHVTASLCAIPRCR